MERHIGIWHKESDSSNSEVGELLIDGNHIEFYSRFHGTIFPEAFIGEDGQFEYKVFVNGNAKPGQNRVVKNTASHRVFYVLMQNFGFSKGTDISGIKEFSFTIPELVGWIGINTVFYCSTDQKEPAAGEYHFQPISIKDCSPNIELYFESKTFESTLTMEDATTITIKKEPRIRVTYEQPSDVSVLLSDIECITQFFGLLIGKISDVHDIRLTVKGQKAKSWLFINRDFSYNLMTQDINDKPRSYHYVFGENLNSYFLNWYKFFNDEQYALLRRIYFSVNDRQDIFAEEVFVEYIRILDGYHTRKYGDAETEQKLKEALKQVSKAIKEKIFTDDSKPIFEEAIQSVIPDWKYNSKNIGNISDWIAAGYLSRKQLSYRLKELDKDHFGIIEHNALSIGKTPHTGSAVIEGKSDDQLIELYYKELADTRNYYSHYKQDKTGVLSFSQMIESINVLKATIISIFLSYIGIDEDTARRMLVFDNELKFQTMDLRKPGERPFPTPKAWMRAQYTTETGNVPEE